MEKAQIDVLGTILIIVIAFVIVQLGKRSRENPKGNARAILTGFIWIGSICLVASLIWMGNAVDYIKIAAAVTSLFTAFIAYMALQITKSKD